MSEPGFDNESLKSLSMKLAAFYKTWDNMPPGEKEKMMEVAREGLEKLKDINFASLSKAEIDKVLEMRERLEDIRLAIGARLFAFASEFSENVKKKAEEGDPEAIKAWEQMKEDYTKFKFGDILKGN